MNDFVARSYSFLIVCITVLLYSLFSNSAPQGCKCQFSSVPMPWEFLVDARTKVSLAWSGLWVQPGVSLLSCMMLASDVQTARKHSSCRAVYSIRYRPGCSDTICPPADGISFRRQSGRHRSKNRGGSTSVRNPHISGDRRWLSCRQPACL